MQKILGSGSVLVLIVVCGLAQHAAAFDMRAHRIPFGDRSRVPTRES